MATPAKPQIDTTGLQPTVGMPSSDEIERPYAANNENQQQNSITDTAVEGVKSSYDNVKNILTPEERPEQTDVTIKIEN